jgi:hypothetical protein
MTAHQNSVRTFHRSVREGQRLLIEAIKREMNVRDIRREPFTQTTLAQCRVKDGETISHALYRVVPFSPSDQGSVFRSYVNQ